jgi:hypothetical protein
MLPERSTALVRTSQVLFSSLFASLASVAIFRLGIGCNLAGINGESAQPGIVSSLFLI